MGAGGKKLAIGVFCVDWRLHQKGVRLPETVRDLLGVDVLDIVALPGPDGLLKAGKEGERDVLLKWLGLLIGAHDPASIAIVGHYSCAGHPVDDAAHDSDLSATLEYFKKATNFPGQMRALSAVRESDSK